jgi:hypothetical protein
MKKSPESFQAEDAHPELEVLDEAVEARLLLSNDLPPGLLRKAKDALALKYGAATTSTGGSLRSLRRWLAKCDAKRAKAKAKRGDA